MSGLEARAARGAPADHARTASHAGTGSALPFSVSGSSSTYSIALRVSRWVISPTITVPGFAAACSRDGDVDRVADHGVPVADLAREHLPGVDPDPQRE